MIYTVLSEDALSFKSDIEHPYINETDKRLNLTVFSFLPKF